MVKQLEKRYKVIRKELARLLTLMRALTPAEEIRCDQLEAELCEVERRLLTLCAAGAH